jgi:hypothetical protein
MSESDHGGPRWLGDDPPRPTVPPTEPPASAVGPAVMPTAPPSSPPASAAWPTTAPAGPRRPTSAAASVGGPVGVMLAVAGLVMGVGAFFTWFRVGTTAATLGTVKGLDTASNGLWWSNIAPGWFALVGGAAVLAAGLVLVRSTEPRRCQSAALVALVVPPLVGVVSYLDYNHAKEAVNQVIATALQQNPLVSRFLAGTVHASVGSGLITTLVGCGLAFVTGLLVVVVGRPAPAPAYAPAAVGTTPVSGPPPSAPSGGIVAPPIPPPPAPFAAPPSSPPFPYAAPTSPSAAPQPAWDPPATPSRGPVADAD